MHRITATFPRSSRKRVLDALADTRVVMVAGARQVGKSTLVADIARHEHPAQIIDLDREEIARAARANPGAFIDSLETPVVLDEVQRGGPQLLLEIKSSVDRDPRPGRFLLTGSANLLATRKAYDTLTGRIETIRLWPLAQAEIERAGGNFVDAMFAQRPPQVRDAPTGRDAFATRIAAGGYPQALSRVADRRTRWFESYLATTLTGDLRDVSDAHKLRAMPQLARLLASQTANLLAPGSISKKLGLHHGTVASYVGLLEAIHLIFVLPGWRPGIGQREVVRPKLHFTDTGLLLHLLRADEARLAADDQVTGKALENFVAAELAKQAEWAGSICELYHYRRGRDEVDVVLENQSGALAAVEVKASHRYTPRDWRPMAHLRDACGERFRAGVLLYTGNQTLPIGDRLWAVPISGLWSAG